MMDHDRDPLYRKSSVWKRMSFERAGQEKVEWN